MRDSYFWSLAIQDWVAAGFIAVVAVVALNLKFMKGLFGRRAILFHGVGYLMIAMSLAILGAKRFAESGDVSMPTPPWAFFAPIFMFAGLIDLVAGVVYLVKFKYASPAARALSSPPIENFQPIANRRLRNKQ